MGRPTGSAVPLLWAHAEYIRLLRSARDGVVFDRIPEVASRYADGKRPADGAVSIWSFACKIGSVSAGSTLRIMNRASFDLSYSLNDWTSAQHITSKSTRFQVDFVDIAVPQDAQGAVSFTFYWRDATRWENHNFAVTIRS